MIQLAVCLFFRSLFWEIQNTNTKCLKFQIEARKILIPINAVLMLAHCLQRCPNIETALRLYHFLFDEVYSNSLQYSDFNKKKNYKTRIV